MSTGLVICSVCRRVVHQTDDGWMHCDGGKEFPVTPRCAGATSNYPRLRSEIVGHVCEADGPAPAKE